MTTTVMNYRDFSVEIIQSNGFNIGHENADLVSLLDALNTLGYQEVTFVETTPGHMTLRNQHMDGRELIRDYDFTINPLDPRLKFFPSDYFKLSEFTSLLPTTTALVNFIRTYLITSFKYERTV